MAPWVGLHQLSAQLQLQCRGCSPLFPPRRLKTGKLRTVRLPDFAHDDSPETKKPENFFRGPPFEKRKRVGVPLSWLALSKPSLTMAESSDPLSLEFVLGFNPTTAVILSHGAGSYKLAYGTGNVVVLCDTATRSQTLLRGHRATVSACLASPDRSLLVSADAAEGGGCSVLVWDLATGSPLAMVEAPHAAGTLALAWAGGGDRPRYLVTLSAPHEATVGGEQEVALWDCSRVWAALRGGGGGGEEEDPSPTLLASTPLPPSAGRQGALTISPSPSPLIGRKAPLGTALGLAAQCTASATPVPSEPGTVGTVQHGWEMATSPGGEGARPGGGAGGRGVVFFSVVNVEITERLKGQGGKPSTTITHSVWHMTASTVAASGSASAPTVTAFIRGAEAPALNTRDELAGSVARATSLTQVAGKPKAVLTAGSAARVVAVSGTLDGSIAQWVAGGGAGASAAAAAAAAAEGGEAAGTLSAASLALSRKELLKVIKVARPAYQNIARGILNAPPEAEAITSLQVVLPQGHHFLIGTADGCVRLYDLHIRLLAWWEELGGGGILALPMAPHHPSATATATATLAATACATADQATLQALGGMPLFLASTERALAIAINPLDFLLPEGSPARNGELVLEGPGANVTDLAVFSPPRGVGGGGSDGGGGGGGAEEGAPPAEEPLLAVALDSGCIHVWSPSLRSLLVVRDLAVGAGAGEPGAHASTYTPTVLAADPLGRALAVGTSMGFLLLLDPRTLGDAQAPLPPATWELPLSSGGRVPGPRITHAAFSPDGYHLATGDALGTVSLYRYTRRLLRRPASSTSALTARSMLLLRKPWVGIVREEEKWLEEEVCLWVYIGRCRAHGGGASSDASSSSSSSKGLLSGLTFSPRLAAPSAAALVTRAVEAGLIGGTSAIPLPAACPPPLGADLPGVPHKVGGNPWWSATPAHPLGTDALHAAAGLSLLASSGSADKRVVVYDCGGSSENRGLLVRPSAAPNAGAAAAAAAAAGWGGAAGAAAGAAGSGGGATVRSLSLRQGGGGGAGGGPRRREKGGGLRL